MTGTVQYVLEYLEDRLPLGYRYRSYFTKHKGTSVRFKPLPRHILGQVPNRNKGVEIHLNSNLRWTQEQLIEIIAHEYRHVWQGTKRFKYYRWCMNRLRTGYWNHPEETDARNFASCVLTELKQDLNFPWW